VADPLFGAKPYTGRLPDSWPRSMAQEPINVGDATYDPLYPFGWGLRTDPARPRLLAARNALAQVAPTKPGQIADVLRARLAVASIDVALAKPLWNADGSVRNAPAVLGALTGATALLDGSSLPVDAQVDAVVSVARDLVQARLAGAAASPAATRAAGLSATAEQQLLQKHPYQAMRQLTAAWQALG
jgi:beta-glucosidase